MCVIWWLIYCHLLVEALYNNLEKANLTCRTKLLVSKSIPSSGTFSEVRVAPDCAFYPFFQTHHRFVAQILFGSVTAVIVVSSSKRHSHWCKSGFEGQYWAKDHGQKPQQQGQSIDQNVREVEARGGVTKSHQHFRYEVPESNWLIVGDMVRLKKRDWRCSESL